MKQYIGSGSATWKLIDRFTGCEKEFSKNSSQPLQLSTIGSKCVPQGPRREINVSNILSILNWRSLYRVECFRGWLSYFQLCFTIHNSYWSVISLQTYVYWILIHFRFSPIVLVDQYKEGVISYLKYYKFNKKERSKVIVRIENFFGACSLCRKEVSEIYKTVFR